MTRRKGLPSSDLKVNKITLHAVASFRTKTEAREHAIFKRLHDQYARVVNRGKMGWYVYVAYRPDGKIRKRGK